MLLQVRAARSKALPTISDRSAMLARGTTAPDSSRVMSRRLPMKRFAARPLPGWC